LLKLNSIGDESSVPAGTAIQPKAEHCPVIAGEDRRQDRNRTQAQEAPMTRTTLTIAAALLAGTAFTSAANAGGVRLGFGFPLGSFVAHSNQSYSGGGYGHDNCDHQRYAARRRHHRPAQVAKAKRSPKVEVASKPDKQPIKTAKLEDKTVTDSSTTTEIAKTPATAASTTTPAATTTPAKTEEPKTIEKTATVEKTASVETSSSDKTDTKTNAVTAKVKHVCRRFSAAVAGLVDVPCQ
jgi:hypothetical protein